MLSFIGEDTYEDNHSLIERPGRLASLEHSVSEGSHAPTNSFTATQQISTMIMHQHLAALLLLATAIRPTVAAKYPDTCISSSSSSFGVYSSRVTSRQKHEERMESAYRSIRPTTTCSSTTNSLTRQEEDEDEVDYDIQDEAATKFDRFEPTTTTLHCATTSNHHRTRNYHRQQQPRQEHHPFLQIPCQLVASAAMQEDSIPVSSSRSSKQASTRTSSASDCCCCIDTGAQRSVMSLECAKACGLMAHVDRRYAGQAVGVGGSVSVLGRIPAGVVQLHCSSERQENTSRRNKHADDSLSLSVMAPSIIIIERIGPKTTGASSSEQNQSIDLLLGLDFLREHQAVLDLQKEDLQLQVNGRLLSVPFMRPKVKGILSAKSAFGIKGGAITRTQGMSKEEYADFSDDEDFDFDPDGVDLTGF
ncbi:hypothetical protein MPSEU_000557400 [Mayamaea pseudoterrestris]|nr:hypothetical protein MPSEU_000557400 [Mayamaea pseudoterrestris]